MSRETRRAVNAREAGRKRRVRGKTAALALACAATMGLGAAHAQDAPAPGQDAVPLPELAYDTFFEPFTDNPVYRLHNPEPFARMAPLFAKYDPLEGLTRPAKVSRVTLPGERYIAYAPIMTAEVGQELLVPISIREPIAPITSLRVFLSYDPAIIVPEKIIGAGIPTEDVFMNTKPDPSYVGDCTECLIAFTTLIQPWSKAGPVFRIQFRAVAPGRSRLSGRLIEVSDYTQNTRSTIFQDGLVTVQPPR